jgi:hypothetical protein
MPRKAGDSDDDGLNRNPNMRSGSKSFAGKKAAKKRPAAKRAAKKK